MSTPVPPASFDWLSDLAPAFTARFQNLYQPVLAKGRPVLAAPRLGYLRQRTLRQMEAVQREHLEQYGQGWWVNEESSLR